MASDEQVHREMRDHFEGLWRRGDPWDLGSSEFERDKYDRQFALLQGRRFPRVLEIGCGAGSFTHRLATVSDRIVALDIAPSAIEQARRSEAGPGEVDYRTADVMEYDVRREGPWDLIVMSETIYCLGWLYSFFRVGWLASELFAATRIGGRLLMANVCGLPGDYLASMSLIRTYNDLFANVGYHVEKEEMFHGLKEGQPVDAIICVFEKRAEGTPDPG